MQVVVRRSLSRQQRRRRIDGRQERGNGGDEGKGKRRDKESFWRSVRVAG
jgi:hypothetical protein